MGKAAEWGSSDPMRIALIPLLKLGSFCNSFSSIVLRAGGAGMRRSNFSLRDCEAVSSSKTCDNLSLYGHETNNEFS